MSEALRRDVGHRNTHRQPGSVARWTVLALNLRWPQHWLLLLLLLFRQRGCRLAARGQLAGQAEHVTQQRGAGGGVNQHTDSGATHLAAVKRTSGLCAVHQHGHDDVRLRR